MPELKYISDYPFPNFHGGINTCEVLIAASHDCSEMDVLMVQRRDEWKRGTSAINQAEVIATKLVNDVLPELFRAHPELRRARVNWYVQVAVGHAQLGKIRELHLDFVWPPAWQRSWLWERLAGRTPVTLRELNFLGTVEAETLLVRL